MNLTIRQELLTVTHPATDAPAGRGRQVVARALLVEV
jgi:hypothetical protein